MMELLEHMKMVQISEAREHNLRVSLHIWQKAIAAIEESRDELAETRGHINDLLGDYERGALVSMDQLVRRLSEITGYDMGEPAEIDDAAA